MATLNEWDLLEWYLAWLELWDVAQKATHTNKILEGYCTRGHKLTNDTNDRELLAEKNYCPRCQSPNVEAGTYIGQCKDCDYVFLIENGRPYRILPPTQHTDRPRRTQKGTETCPENADKRLFRAVRQSGWRITARGKITQERRHSNAKERPSLHSSTSDR